MITVSARHMRNLALAGAHLLTGSGTGAGIGSGVKGADFLRPNSFRGVSCTSGTMGTGAAACGVACGETGILCLSDGCW